MEVEVVEKRFKKRKGECSILKESASKKHKSNDDYDKSEVEKFLVEASNNLMNNDDKHKDKDVGTSLEKHSSQKREIESSNLKGESATKDQRSCDHPADVQNHLNWCWNRTSRGWQWC
ncbi:hypothetical protein P3S68_008410 [Capsicum galapagoense]